MERKKTPFIVYVVLAAVVIALGIFIVQRLAQNAQDRKAIDKSFKDSDDTMAGRH